MIFYIRSYDTFKIKESVGEKELELLEKYKPKTFISKTEKYDLVNAIDYFQNNKINYDNSILCFLGEQDNKKYLYYFYCFEKDGGKNILNMKTVDAHKDDIECLLVELTDDEITGLCYMPHSTKEHFWIRNKYDLKEILDNSTHPPVYIANDKHSAYPISGPIYRFFFFGNDNCEDPQLKKTKLVYINTFLLKKNTIGENMIGFGRRINKDLTFIDNIKLSDLKFRKLISFGN